uniref:Transmembrane protein n=1 Tax=Megaselia scalaris TaxID=36166 RepID=T1GRF0_MEGSC
MASQHQHNSSTPKKTYHYQQQKKLEVVLLYGSLILSVIFGPICKKRGEKKNIQPRAKTIV